MLLYEIPMPLYEISMLCYAMMYVVKYMLRLIVSTCNNINYNFLNMQKKKEVQLFNVSPTYLHDHGFELESTLSKASATKATALLSN